MAILITGFGYIGAQLAQDLVASGERVVALENFFCTPRRAATTLASELGIDLIRGSVNHPASLQRALRAAPVRAVVHLAAQPSANPAAASVHYTELTNLVGARLVLEVALAAGVEMVVLGSSFKVYGDTLPDRVSERQPYGPVGDLAHLSKIYAEKLAEMLAASRGLRCIAVRLGITYGRSPVMKTDPRFMTVPNRFSQLVAQGQPLTIHPTATQPAGFLEVRQASRALQAALKSSWPDRYRAVNAVDECLTVGEVAAEIARAAQARGLPTTILGPASALPRQLSVESSLPAAYFEPKPGMAESIGAVIDYFRAHQRAGT